MTSSVKYRWYQTETKVVVEVPIKNLVDENVSVNYTRDSLNVTAKLPSDEQYSLKLNLHNAIVPEQCSYKVRQTKIEINLPKEVHLHWVKLGKDDPEPNASVSQKNWDKVVQENWSEKDGSLDQLFSTIYTDSDDDQKRAMLKSFTESGGTVLSTNWEEVGKQKTEIKPPDGVEFKPWN